jgi:hypothetical protein
LLFVKELLMSENEKPEGRIPFVQQPSGLNVDKAGYNGAVEKHRAKVLPFSSQGRPLSPAKPAAGLGRVLAFRECSTTPLCRGLDGGTSTHNSQTLYLQTRMAHRRISGGNSLTYNC